MGMSRCYSLMKCLLIIFNIIFLCVGSALCGFAAWALWEGSGRASAAGLAALVALAAWGGALALGALLALGGLARGAAGALAAALALLLLAGAAQGAAAWWAAQHRPALERALRAELQYALRSDYGVLHSRTHLLDVVQQALECCGVEGAHDWRRAAWQRLQEDAPPGQADDGAAVDLSVGAPALHYWVPASCCARAATADECAAARRVAAPQPRPAPALHAAACAPRVLLALARMARAPLALCGALLALQALAAPLTLALALWLRAHAPRPHKA